MRGFVAMPMKDQGKKSNKSRNRVEPYLHFGKHTLRAFPTDEGGVLFTTKNMSEADYLKLSNIADNVLTADNEEFYFRPDIGASETFAMSDLVNDLQASLDDDEKSGLHGLKEVFSEKKLLEAFAFFNLGNDYTRDEAAGLKHMEYIVNFWEKDSREKGEISRNLMMFSARLFLASTALHKQNAVINHPAAMASALQGKKKLPRSFKDFCKRPNGFTLCKALLSALKRSPKWSKESKRKGSYESEWSSEEEVGKSSSSKAEQMKALERPVQTLDLTADGHLLLETVQEVSALPVRHSGWPFLCLIGRRSKRALALQRLSSFGKGAHRHKKFWLSLSYSLVDCGFLEPAGKKGSRRISYCASLTTDGLNALDKLRKGYGVCELQFLAPSAQLDASMQLPAARKIRVRIPRENRRAKERRRRLC